MGPSRRRRRHRRHHRTRRRALGDVVFVETPDVGKTVKAGDSFAVVESVKAASDVYAPVSGEVVEANAALGSAPRDRQRRPRRRRLVRQDQGRRRLRARRPDGPRRLRRLPGHASKPLSRTDLPAMRYLPLTPDDRARHAGAPSAREIRSTTCSWTCPRRRARDGFVDLPPHAGELEVEREPAGAGGQEHRRRARCAVLLRGRRLSPPCAGDGGPHHPALGVPDQLHALPAGNRPGHAAGTCSSSRPRSRT